MWRLLLTASLLAARVSHAQARSGQARQARVEPDAPTRLRVEYLDSPISVDVAVPRFSWALPPSSARGSVQSAFQLVVSTAPVVGAAAVVWDSGVVPGNRTLNVPYGGAGGSPAAAAALLSDTDYSWSVCWVDAHGERSPAALGTFSVAILGDGPAASSPNWHSAEWLSSELNGSLSTYRADFDLPVNPVRARMYYVGLGYAKTWLNGNLTDSHELGQYVTFQRRVLYDCVDVSRLVRAGRNVVGIMLGNGWFDSAETSHGPRQFLLLLSVTSPDGSNAFFHSATAASAAAATAAAAALTFTATTGPEQSANFYKGEKRAGTHLSGTHLIPCVTALPTGLC